MPKNPIQLLRDLQVEIYRGQTDFDTVADKIDDCLRHGWYAVFFTDGDLAADAQDLDFYEDEQKAKAVDLVEFLAGDTTPESIAVTTPDGRVITTEPVTDAEGVFGHFTVTGD